MKQELFGMYIEAENGQPPVWNESLFEELNKHSFIVIKNVVFSDENDLLDFGGTIGTPLEYAFGKIFKIQSSDKEIKTQLSTRPMCIHQDAVLPDKFSEIVILYCESTPEEGGESLLCNNRRFLKTLKREAPDLYNFFMTEKVGYLNHTSKYYAGDINESEWNVKKCVRAHYSTKEIMPYFALNQFDDSERNFTAKFVGLSLEESDVYMRRLDQFMRSKEVMIEHKLAVGDLIIFDNSLVSHGRNGFKKGEKRVLNRLQLTIEMNAT